MTNVWKIWQISHCAIDGTAFACDGGGRGGGQFGALSPPFFEGGFLRLAWRARGAGVGWVLVSAATGAAAVVGGGGARGLIGAGAFGFENWTVTCSLAWLALLTLKDLFGLYGELIFTNALGESGSASRIGSSWPWSEHCLWVGLLSWPGFGAAPCTLESGDGPWLAVELQAAEVLEALTGLGSMEDELLDVKFWWVGAAVSAAGLAHEEVPTRLTEPDVTKKRPPLSWEFVLLVFERGRW